MGVRPTSRDGEVCRGCGGRRYRVSWASAGHALLCATCDWGVTLDRASEQAPTWWFKVVGES